ALRLRRDDPEGRGELEWRLGGGDRVRAPGDGARVSDAVGPAGEALRGARQRRAGALGPAAPGGSVQPLGGSGAGGPGAGGRAHPRPRPVYHAHGVTADRDAASPDRPACAASAARADGGARTTTPPLGGRRLGRVVRQAPRQQRYTVHRDPQRAATTGNRIHCHLSSPHRRVTPPPHRRRVAVTATGGPTPHGNL